MKPAIRVGIHLKRFLWPKFQTFILLTASCALDIQFFKKNYKQSNCHLNLRVFFKAWCKFITIRTLEKETPAKSLK